MLSDTLAKPVDPRTIMRINLDVKENTRIFDGL
jgi:hypothetical protein